ncbi:MAG TPA: hypothetical protein VGJ15_10380 [Pirellulales bacterium]|jgi:hypothetical protein
MLTGRRFVILTLLVFCTGCDTGKTSNSTPRAAFDAFKGALLEKDFPRAFDQFTPDTQPLVLGLLAFCDGIEAENDPVCSEQLKKATEKYHLTMYSFVYESHGTEADHRKIWNKAVESVKDKPGLFAELLQVIENTSQSKDRSVAKQFGNAELRDVQQSGDTATGILNTTWDGQPRSIKIGFERVNGNWLIDAYVTRREGWAVNIVPKLD